MSQWHPMRKLFSQLSLLTSAKEALAKYGEGYVDDDRQQIAVEAIEGRISEAAYELKIQASGRSRSLRVSLLP